MAMLDDVLKNAQPGVNPQLEDMVAKMLAGSGMAGPQAASAAGRLSPGASPLGVGPAPAGGMPPAPAGGAAPQGQPGPQGNETFKVLVARGVPPQLAAQAISNPQLLRQLLAKLFQGQQGADQQPQAAPEPDPNSQPAPPLGGGGGYG